MTDITFVCFLSQLTQTVTATEAKLLLYHEDAAGDSNNEKQLKKLQI